MKVSRKAIHIIIGICVVVAVAVFVAMTMMKYEIEGEKNMPFELSKIMIVSTAEGYANEGSKYKWDFDVFQNNDIYISIAKNKNYKKTEVIDKIVINNIKVDEQPQKGEIVVYRPNNETATSFACEEKYEVKENLEYIGSKESDLGNLQISNQGGMLIFRVSNKDLHRYKSNDGKKIVHDGTLLKKADIKNEEIKCKMSFDIIIELKSEKKYKGTITIDLPQGDIIKNGKESVEITNFDDVVFKRM